ncbi:MAG: hypothetical protein JO247_21065 [Chloroflexi bacterium]|nr:hypothetical protein [Chloroflexota bacterium]
MLRIELRQLELPSPDGLRRTHVALVQLRSSDTAESGFGYCYAMNRPAIDAAAAAAAALLAGRDDLDSLLALERQHIATDDAERLAVAAISLAAWDLAGKQAGRRAADMLAGPHAVSEVEAYRSALFAGDVGHEARSYRAQGFRRIKMRLGGPWLADVERVRTAAGVFGGPSSIAVDAGCRWEAENVRRFVDSLEVDLQWFEDPVPYAVLESVRDAGVRLAAGETCSVLPEFVELVDHGADVILLDVQRVGGPLHWIELARTLAARGVRIGSHVFPHYSAHLLAGVSDPAPVEVLDWWDGLFAPLRPAENGCVPVAGPGFGISARADVLEAGMLVWERSV